MQRDGWIIDAWLVKSVPDFFIIKKSIKQFITDNASLLFCCCDIRIAIYFFNTDLPLISQHIVYFECNFCIIFNTQLNGTSFPKTLNFSTDLAKQRSKKYLEINGIMSVSREQLDTILIYNLEGHFYVLFITMEID
jgi:hypothetical protein